MKPRATPEWNEPGEASSFDAAGHEAADVSAERGAGVALEIRPAHEGNRHENRGDEADREAEDECVSPEGRRRDHAGADVGRELERVDLMVEEAIAPIHAGCFGTLSPNDREHLQLHQVFRDNDAAVEVAPRRVHPHLVGNGRILGGYEV